MLTREQYKAFLLNAAAVGTNETMSIDLGSVCGVGCIFCFNHADFDNRMIRLPLITEEEFEDALDFVNPYKNPIIVLGGGKRIWWGEPSLHPQFIRFCHRINERYPEATIEVDLTGLYLDDDQIEELKQIRNLELYLSVNTLDPALRTRYYKLNRLDRVYRILERIPVKMAFLKYHGNPSSHIMDIRTLLKYDTVQYVSPAKIHWTHFSKSDVREHSRMSLETWGRCMEEVYDTCDDERFIAELQFMHDPVDQKSRLFPPFLKLLHEVIELQGKLHGENFVLCLAESTYAYVRETFPGIDAILVKNISYGGSVTASGQLNFDDILAAISSEPKPGKTYIFPSDMIDDRGNDRLGKSVKEAKHYVRQEFGAYLEEAHLKRWIYLPTHGMSE